MLHEDRIADLSKRLEDERRGPTNQHVNYCIKVRQNISKHLKVLNNCMGHPIMHKTPNRN